MRGRGLKRHPRPSHVPRGLQRARNGRADILGMDSSRPLKSISDAELLRHLWELVRESRRVEADLVAHIGEVDGRRLYAREASPSMFAYCTEVLHLSEAEAYLRIAVARASREHPMLLRMLREGRLHLSGIAKLAPHLTRENRESVLERAAHRSKRQIEELIAELWPRPDVPAAMRKLPGRESKRQPAPGSPVRAEYLGAGVEPSPDRLPAQAVEVGPDRVATPWPELRPDRVGALRSAAPVSGPRRLSRVEPLAPARYLVQFTATAELRGKLERLRALMWSSVPGGDLAWVIETAVTEKLERLEAQRFGKTKAPRKGLEQTDVSPFSRHIPAAVKRLVRKRDGNQCGYVDDRGRRCTARDRLEFHHRRPFGLGGDHSPQNVGLLCRTHNQYLAELDYGTDVMARHRGRPDRVSEASGVYSTGEVLQQKSPGGRGSPSPLGVARCLTG